MNVWHVPDLKKNLLSLEVLKARGYSFSGTNGEIKVTKSSMMILKREQTTIFYKVTRSIIVGDALAATEKEDIIRFWHMRLWHMSERGLQALQKECSTIYPILQLDFCKFCIMGRQYRVAFSTSQHKTKGLLDFIRTDVWGLRQ